MDMKMSRKIGDLFLAANCNSSVKAVVLYGHNKFFSSGNDLIAGFKSGKFDLKGKDFTDDNEDSK